MTKYSKTYEVINVEKQVAIEAKELMLQLQQEHQNTNTNSNNKPNQESSHSTIDVADQLAVIVGRQTINKQTNGN